MTTTAPPPPPSTVQPKGTAFVIGPIGEPGSETRERSDKVLRHIIISVVQDVLGYEVVRADGIAEPGLITHQTIQQLVDAPLVIADLTDWNANVFYELAVRHVARKPVVCMIAPDERSPFDTTDVRVIPLHLDLSGAEEITKPQLKAQIESLDVLAANGPIRNPVTAALDTLALYRSTESTDQVLARILTAIENLHFVVAEAGARPAAQVATLTDLILRVLAPGLAGASDETVGGLVRYRNRIVHTTFGQAAGLSGSSVTDTSAGTTIPSATPTAAIPRPNSE